MPIMREKTRSKVGRIPDDSAAEAYKKGSGTRLVQKLKRSLLSPYANIYILVVLSVAFGIVNPVFFSPTNILNIARQVSIIGIMAGGMTFAILCRQIDLSVGSIVACSGVVTVVVIKSGGGIVLGIICGIMTGGAIGFINGVITARFDIHSLLVTLGTSWAIRGLLYLFTGARSVWGIPSRFAYLGKGYVLGIPIPAVILLLCFLLYWFILRRMVFGRYVYAVGANPKACGVSGINVPRIITAVLTISGLTAGVSGVVLAARLSSGQPIVGEQYALQVIAATVVGGVSLSGGIGNIFGALIGVLIIGIIYNGLNLAHVSPYWHMMGVGGILIVSLIADQIRQRVAGVTRF